MSCIGKVYRRPFKTCQDGRLVAAPHLVGLSHVQLRCELCWSFHSLEDSSASSKANVFPFCTYCASPLFLYRCTAVSRCAFSLRPFDLCTLVCRAVRSTTKPFLFPCFQLELSALRATRSAEGGESVVAVGKGGEHDNQQIDHENRASWFAQVAEYIARFRVD